MLDKFFVSPAAEHFRLKYTPVNLRNYSFYVLCDFICLYAKVKSPLLWKKEIIVERLMDITSHQYQ